MIVLDTNVLSALMERDNHPVATTWLDRQVAENLFITTVNVHELQFGIHKMQTGRRRRALAKALHDAIDLLEGRVLPVDIASALISGEIQAQRKIIGRPIALGDCLIAGIVASRGARIATRNVRHFQNLGFEIMNPWD